MAQRQGRKCPTCDGEGEVYSPTSVPDSEPWDICQVCNGTGKLPTPEEIAALRQHALECYWGEKSEQLIRCEYAEEIERRAFAIADRAPEFAAGLMELADRLAVRPHPFS